MSRVIGYVRVSSEMQKEKDNSIRSQIKSIKKYCDDYDYELVGIYKDEGISGLKSSREGLNEMMVEIQRSKVDIVFLGTGSAAPSKLRGSSSIHIRVQNYGGILLDCGEGTLGSFQRQYGVGNGSMQNGISSASSSSSSSESRSFDNYNYIIHLLHIRFIWISHAHLDHQGGLYRFLHQRHLLLENSNYS